MLWTKWSAWLVLVVAAPCVVLACSTFTAADPPPGPPTDEAGASDDAATGDAHAAVDANGNVDGGSSRYATLILQGSPLHFWRMDDRDRTLYDAVDSARSGSYSGMYAQNQPGALMGDADTSVMFGGGYVQVDRQLTFEQQTTFTVEAWVKPAATNVAGTPSPMGILTNDANETSGLKGFMFELSPAAAAGADGWQVTLERWSNFNTSSYVAGGVVPASAWSHVAATFDGKASTVYLNGATVGTMPDDIVLAGASSLVIGAREGGNGGPFMGQIDEVAVYGRALSSADLLAHYLAGVNP